MKWTYPMVSISALVSSVRKWNPLDSATNELFTYIDISSVNRETKQVEEAVEVLTHEAPSRARQLVKAGDVLVSTVRPNLNAVAHLDGQFDGATASTGFTVLRTKANKLDARYLYYWVRTPYFVESMVQRSTGASYPAVSDSIVKESAIPLPPLEEQQRIAAILDKADAVRRKRKEAIALTEELLRSAFLEMFGDPVTNPKGWHTKRLGELAQFVGGGTPSRQKAEYYQGDICWATPKDMGVDVLTDTEEHITSEAIEQSATKLVGIDSLLVVVKSKVLGRKLPIARTTVPTCFGQDLKAIIPHEASIQRYLHRHIKYGEKTLLRQARGVNTEGLTLVHLQNYQVMIPSASEVARFVGLDSVLENTRNKQKALWEESINFFNSLLQRAFLGEL
jgi:type I restriction enzyme S subunit